MNFLKIWVDMALLSFCICCINTILIGKNICFLHAESPDEFTLKASSLEYILDRCSRKGKNRMCLTWWHIPYFGQRQEWSAKWGTHCSISTARPKRHSTTCLPATAATRRGFSACGGPESHRDAGGVCFRCPGAQCLACGGCQARSPDVRSSRQMP